MQGLWQTSRPIGTFGICAALLALSVASAGCVGEIDGVEEGLSEIQLDPLFDDAARSQQVPLVLLQAISHAETRWAMVQGGTEFDEVAPAYGVMGLRGDHITIGASRAGITEEDARNDVASNILAGAALLSFYADELGIDRSDLGAWAPVVARFSGIADDDGRARYVYEDIYRVIRSGARDVMENGLVKVDLKAVADVTPDYPAPLAFAAGGGDYDGALWRPSPNTSSRPSGAAGKPSMVIIHTCEGKYSGCWNYLRRRSARVSAHYVVKEDGSEISQLVREGTKAWHIGAKYKCSLNNNVLCARNGASSNNFTIGIEHAGFASQRTFSNGQLEASAKLVCAITKRYGIPRDANHIVGHGQLQPYNRTDPGANWPWAYYIERVRAHCGEGSQPPTPTDPTPTDPTPTDPTPTPPTTGAIIIDSNNARNDSSVARIQVSGNWRSSNNVRGYFGTGYFWGRAESVSDGATFSFYMAADGTKTIDAWWPAASDRSTRAPWVIVDANGTKLGTVYKNQQTGGQQWNVLGTWRFKKGWNRVILSRWTAAGSVVVADAVRVR